MSSVPCSRVLGGLPPVTQHAYLHVRGTTSAAVLPTWVARDRPGRAPRQLKMSSFLCHVADTTDAIAVAAEGERKSDQTAPCYISLGRCAFLGVQAARRLGEATIVGRLQTLNPTPCGGTIESMTVGPKSRLCSAQHDRRQANPRSPTKCDRTNNNTNAAQHTHVARRNMSFHSVIPRPRPGSAPMKRVPSQARAKNND